MTPQDIQFLELVKAYVEENPEVGAYVSDYVARGIETSRKEVLARAADMEVALAVAIATRYNNRDAIILDKLKTWKDRSSLQWDSTIELLESKLK
jgi:hypothetical protein